MTELQPYIIEIPELLSNRIARRLIFEIDGLSIEKPLGFSTPQFIPFEDIVSLRSGIKWINGYWFTFGRQFIIELKHQDGTKTSIKLNSYYGIRRQIYDEVWSNIIDHLYSYYFASQLDLYIELHKLNQMFTLAGIRFHPNGISWDKNNIMPWKQIALSNYRTYFVIHRKDDVKQNKSFNFLKDWDAYFLQAMLKYVVEEHEKIFTRGAMGGSGEL